MDRSVECRKTAAQCFTLADESPTLEDRERWERIAHRWIERAVEAEHEAAGQAKVTETASIARLTDQLQKLRAQRYKESVD
jgi:hypothetical protein